MHDEEAMDMKCMYCGRENPEGEIYCECGRPLRLGSSPTMAASGGSSYTPSPDSPFAAQTLDSVKRTRSFPWKPLALLLLVLIGVGIFFLIRMFSAKHITDEASWETINETSFSITVPPEMEKGEMLTSTSSTTNLLAFYTSRLAGFDVSVHRYTDPEKEMYSGLTAEQFAEAQKIRTTKINDQLIEYKVRPGKNYVYIEYNSHHPGYIKKSDEVWYIEAMFPTENAYYLVCVYCAQDDKDEYHEAMLKWLDSFVPKL